MANKWVNLEEDEELKNLMGEIKWNKSPAVFRIKRFLGEFLEAHGYDLSKSEDEVRVEKIVSEEMPIKRARMVSTGRKPISDELVSKIKRMRLEGHSVRFIASELKVGRGTVEKYMKPE